jgi:hypothetical protein
METKAELQAMGFEPTPVPRAIRAKYLDCSGGSHAEAAEAQGSAPAARLDLILRPAPRPALRDRGSIRLLRQSAGAVRRELQTTFQLRLDDAVLGNQISAPAAPSPPSRDVGQDARPIHNHPCPTPTLGNRFMDRPHICTKQPQEQLSSAAQMSGLSDNSGSDHTGCRSSSLPIVSLPRR